MIVVDSGPLVAIADAGDQDHERCLAAFAELREPLLIPSPVLGEVGYMVHRQIGSPGEARFLRSQDDGAFALASLAFTDVHRMAELIETYADLHLGTVDAAVIAVAERLRVTTIANSGPAAFHHRAVTSHRCVSAASRLTLSISRLSVWVPTTLLDEAPGV